MSKSRFFRHLMKRKNYAKRADLKREMNKLVYKGDVEFQRFQFPKLNRAGVKSRLRNVRKQAKHSTKAIMRRMKFKRIK